MTPQEARSKRYAETYTEVESLITRLSECLTERGVDAKTANWADIEDLARVRDHLREATQAIGDASPEEEDKWGL